MKYYNTPVDYDGHHFDSKAERDRYADEFAEMACRKLWRLGYIVKDGEDWKRSEE